MSYEKDYLSILHSVVRTGLETPDRTGTGVYKLLNQPINADLRGGKVPLITTKRVFWKTALTELLWILSGQTNIKPLQEKNCHIWDEWADKDGNLGPVYGKQLRDWSMPGKPGLGIDQLQTVIDSIQDNPFSRRHIISMWNVGDLNKMALVPCHLLYQFHVDKFNRLYLTMIQRSADMFLGVPFNIFNGAMLTHIIGYFTGTKPTGMYWLGTDSHVYKNHLDAVEKQIHREPIHCCPRVEINSGITDINQLEVKDFRIFDYLHHPSLIAPVAV